MTPPITRSDLSGLTAAQSRRLAIEIVESLLPRYEKSFGGDTRPRRCIDMARDFIGMPGTLVQAHCTCSPYRAAIHATGRAVDGALKLARRPARERQMTAMAAIASMALYAAEPDATECLYQVGGLAADVHRMLNRDEDAFIKEFRARVAELARMEMPV